MAANTCRTCGMRRATIFENGRKEDGRVIALTDDSLEAFLTRCATTLNLPKASRLYTQDGGLLDDLTLIRDDELLYVSQGEPFISNTAPLRNGNKHNGSSSRDRLKRQSGALPVSAMTATAMTDGGGEWITLNVGGRYFTTTRSTLTNKEPDSMLARMFANDEAHSWSSSVDLQGAYLIDRSPVYFEALLNYLRHGELILDSQLNPEGVLEEAKFFGVLSLVELLESRISDRVPATDATPITRREFVFRLISTEGTQELRCQGVNFTGANLSKLDLRCINFKYAVLKGADLSGANLSFCNFERADISGAKLDGANLMGVKMLCVNLECTSMLGCNFEDPAGNKANMEGANMKFVNLEGSHMAGVILRVATLKNAKLQNCDLRGAVLAGADLENCNLSGCDLQEANLRGANLKGAAFELMLNPLHMSQAVR